MNKNFPKSGIVVLGLGLFLATTAGAQQGPTVPGTLNRSWGMTQGSSGATAPAPSATNSGSAQNTTRNNVQNDDQMRSAVENARQDSGQCEGPRRGSSRQSSKGSNNTGFSYYQGAPAYPGPNVALPTPGTYFYQSPYYGYGYGPNGYGYGYNPTGTYYNNGYQRGYGR